MNTIPELSKLELNQKNVMELLFKCKATPQTKNVNDANFYTTDSVRKAPIIKLDEDIVLANKKLIGYWFGQLLPIHQQQEEMTPAEGFFNYNNERWASDDRALYALYYLGTSSTAFAFFEDGIGHARTRHLQTYYRLGLKPTYSPNDPRFKLEDAKRALEALGVSI